MIFFSKWHFLVKLIVFSLFFPHLVYVFMNEILCSYDYLKMQERLMIFFVSQITKKCFLTHFEGYNQIQKYDIIFHKIQRNKKHLFKRDNLYMHCGMSMKLLAHWQGNVKDSSTCIFHRWILVKFTLVTCSSATSPPPLPIL